MVETTSAPSSSVKATGSFKDKTKPEDVRKSNIVAAKGAITNRIVYSHLLDLLVILAVI
jgi:hypothetical protein